MLTEKILPEKILDEPLNAGENSERSHENGGKFFEKNSREITSQGNTREFTPNSEVFTNPKLKKNWYNPKL